MSRDLNGLITWLRDWFDDIYLTEHQDISGKANISDLGATAFSNDYSDLDNKPSIPSDVSDLTDTNNTQFTPKSHTHGYITNGGELRSTISSNSNIGNVVVTNTKTDMLETVTQLPYSKISGTPTLSNVATSGSYNDLADKPTIPTVPTNVSAFTNDSGYLTSHQDISGKANTSDLGSLAYEDDIDLSTHDVSELTDTNDTAFTPKSHNHGNLLDTGQIGLVNNRNMNVVTNNQGMITVENKISNTSDLTNDGNNGNDTYVESGDLSTVATTGSYNDLDDKPTIPSAYTHPTELSSALTTSSLYKIKANTKGHITEATSVGIDNTNGGTSGSSSLITSGAVYTGLNGKANSNHNHNSLVGESGLTLIEDDDTNNTLNALNNKLIYDYGLSDIIYYDRDGTGFNYLDYSNEVAIKGDIPTDVSDLTDTSNTQFTPKTHNHGNITNDGKCSTTGTVDVSRGDLLLFADATSNQYTVKGSSFIDALNDLILDLIDEGES